MHPKCSHVVLLFLSLFLLTLPVHSQDTGSSSSKKIILIGPQAEQEQLNKLRDVINLHINNLDTNVEIVITEQHSTNIMNQVVIIRSLLRTSSAFSAIWIESSKKEVFLFVSNKNSEKVFIHTIPFEEGDWVAKCDTIAVLVRSALISWLDTPAEPLEPTTPQGEKEQNEAPEPNRPLFVADIGYSVSLLDPGESPVHGASLGLGLLLGKHLEIRLSTRLFQKLELPISGRHIDFHRVPSTLSMGMRLPLGPHEIGLQAGMVVDATYLRGIADSETRDETSLVHFGFTPSLSYRFSIWRFVSLWLDIGPEFYFRSYFYTWRGEKVLDYGAVQGRVSLGLAFIM